MINWYEEVKEYKAQYDNECGIHEWVDALLPIYYNDILNVFTEVLDGSGLGYGIPENMNYRSCHTIGDIMQYHIYEQYYEDFMFAWNHFEEEE